MQLATQWRMLGCAFTCEPARSVGDDGAAAKLAGAAKPAEAAGVPVGCLARTATAALRSCGEASAAASLADSGTAGAAGFGEVRLLGSAGSITQQYVSFLVQSQTSTKHVRG